MVEEELETGSCKLLCSGDSYNAMSSISPVVQITHSTLSPSCMFLFHWEVRMWKYALMYSMVIAHTL